VKIKLCTFYIIVIIGTNTRVRSLRVVLVTVTEFMVTAKLRKREHAKRSVYHNSVGYKQPL